MIEISPKIFAPNYFSFFIRRLKIQKASSSKFWRNWYLGVVVLSFCTMLISRKSSIQEMQMIEKIMWAFLCPILFVIIFLVIFLPMAFFMIWPKKWIYEVDHVRVCRRESSKILPYSDFVKIVLDSPYSAELYFKKSGLISVEATAWYGSSKDEWLTFIAFLRTKIESVDTRIYVVRGTGHMEHDIARSAEEAYDHVKSL